MRHFFVRVLVYESARDNAETGPSARTQWAGPGTLPLFGGSNYYWEVFDPNQLSEPIEVSLANDLSGLYSEVAHLPAATEGGRAW